MFKLGIRNKILLGFIVVAMLNVPASIYSIRVIHEINASLTKLIDQAYPRLQALLEMKITVLRVTSFILNFNTEIETTPVNESTPTKIGATKDKLLAYLEEIEDWQKLYQQHLSSHEKISLDLQKFMKVHEAVMLIALENFSAREQRLIYSSRINSEKN